VSECPICLGPLASGTVCTLPCSHTFHTACVEGLRSFGIKQASPMCRAERTTGPEKLFDEAVRRYDNTKRRLDRGQGSWGALIKAHQREMNKVIDMWRKPAARACHLPVQPQPNVPFRPLCEAGPQRGRAVVPEGL
jgi:hypothetical protein